MQPPRGIHEGLATVGTTCGSIALEEIIILCLNRETDRDTEPSMELNRVDTWIQTSLGFLNATSQHVASMCLGRE